MGKKENLEPREESAPAPSGIQQKIQGKLALLFQKTFAIIKFLLGVCLLPYLYSSTVSFLKELPFAGTAGQDLFWQGVISFIVIYLFIWEPAVIYAKGQKILEFIFSFFKPLVRVAPYLLPVYTIVLFIIYCIISLFNKSSNLLNYAIFIFGFTLALHLVFSAKSLRSKQGDFLKGNYIFGFSFVYILNISLLALFLNLLFAKFSFVNFTNNSIIGGASITKAIFGQLFILK